MIYSKQMLQDMRFGVYKEMNVGYNWNLLVGTKIIVTTFNGRDIKFKVVPKDENLQKFADSCKNANLVGCKMELENLKEGLVLLENEPEMFEYKNMFGEKKLVHKEGKLCNYSYLKSLGYFHDKDEFKELITRYEQDVKDIESGNKDRYYFDIVSKQKYEVSVEEFNNHIMEL